MAEPYIEALSFIGNNQEILDEIESNKRLKKKISEYSLNTYLKERINNIINDYNINNKNEAKKSEELKENPYMIFNNTFTDLHTLFGGNKAKNSGLKSTEMNDEKALEGFKRFEEDDRTIISKLFYGRVRKEKFCTTCKLTQYSYIYQRAFDLNMDRYNSDINLEDEMNKLITKEIIFEFCSMCSEKKKMQEIKTIVELPKIIVIVVRGNNSNKSRINFETYLFKECYELVGIESQMTIKSNIFSLLFRCFNPSPKKKHQYISKNEIQQKMSQFYKEQPYVLYYERVKKKEKKIKNIINKIVERGDNDINSNNELINTIDKSELITNKKNKKKKIVNICTNQDEIFENKNSQNNINNIYKKNTIKQLNKGKPITINFKFKNDKELFLDTNDCKLFKDILQDFYNKYKIIISNIIYNSTKIELNRTPTYYKMKNNSYIDVLDDLEI